MKHIRILFIPIVAFILIAACSSESKPVDDGNTQTLQQSANDNEHETDIDVVDLPTAVMSAFSAAYPEAEILGASRESEKGETIFEIECRDNGVRKDVTYTEAGALSSVKEMIQVHEVPAVIAQSARAAHPGMKLDEAEKILKGESIFYEIILEDENDNEVEVLLDASGTILETEVITNQDEDDGNKDNGEDDGDQDDQDENEG